MLQNVLKNPIASPDIMIVTVVLIMPLCFYCIFQPFNDTFTSTIRCVGWRNCNDDVVVLKRKDGIRPTTLIIIGISICKHYLCTCPRITGKKNEAIIYYQSLYMANWEVFTVLRLKIQSSWVWLF